MTKETASSAEHRSYLSTGEVGRILGVHPVAIRQMVVQGRLPAMKIGRTWIIPRDAVVEFAKTYMKGPGRRKPMAQEGRQA